MDLTRLQRSHARGVIIDHQNLNGVEVTVVAPVVRKLGAGQADTLLDRFDLVGTSANARAWIVPAAARLDDQVIVGQQERKFSIGRLELKPPIP